ncbi:MAG: DUF4382 domain-containing protein [Leptolyngbyaceae cyanobacterium SM1_1_3]|nr:DUF4382 domain-containing protein [Leptolyngbyaceae cyanobacterium SM1_1_3]NJN02114.1 DUF4382 domain-containing protein [Leptolyngbyaceae cyanobacterium RM1_1_2]NJO09722.1 DUF4382 domain-containing protein [Leptolyngbyaceae cyanobacterium SL_1_1]
MNQQALILLSGVAIVAAFSGGCTAEQPQSAQPSAQSDEQSETVSKESGTLELRANGEDFVRQGFVTKDGWQIDFEHTYVTLADVKAYQSEPPFDANADEELKAIAEVPLVETQTVDLAEGNESAEPILVTQTDAPSGQYNALSFRMVPAEAGPASGQVVMLVGTAEKEGQTIDFTLKFDQPYNYVCGDFVGETRKGILNTDDSTDLEATFHFDHIFGDGEAAPDDAINTGALGFEPIAALAENQQVEADWATLQQQLSAEDSELLESALMGLAHVGEGHCKETEIPA